jgi:molybdate transport system substrate-binding protein
MNMSRVLRAGLTAAIFAFAPIAARAASVTMFAAASLTDALTDVGKAYKAKTGNDVVFSFAASSVLAKQIEASGGADLFMSADSDWMSYLDKKGLVQHDTRADLLGNHLVVVAPADQSVSLMTGGKFDFAGALHGGKLAVADPASVPAGKYAKASLTQLGAWNSVKDNLASAENVRAALAYVARGEAPLGIVYTTDALAEKKVHVVAILPDSTHAPIVYPAALVKDAKPEAKAFLAFLSGKQARAIFEKDGFILLGSK